MGKGQFHREYSGNIKNRLQITDYFLRARDG